MTCPHQGNLSSNSGSFLMAVILVVMEKIIKSVMLNDKAIANFAFSFLGYGGIKKRIIEFY